MLRAMATRIMIANLGQGHYGVCASNEGEAEPKQIDFLFQSEDMYKAMARVMKAGEFQCFKCAMRFYAASATMRAADVTT